MRTVRAWVRVCVRVCVTFVRPSMHQVDRLMGPFELPLALLRR